MMTAIQPAESHSQKRHQPPCGLAYVISMFDTFAGWILQPEVILILIVFIVLVIVIWHQMLSIFVTELVPSSSVSSPPDLLLAPGNRLAGYKFILVWAGCFGRKDCGWGGSAYYFQGLGCPESRCMVITDHDQLSRADIVVFHIRDLRYVSFTVDMPPRHRPDQIWVFFTHESPYNTYIPHGLIPWPTDLSLLDGMFNATMTYMRDSDFFLPYLYYVPKPQPSHEITINTNKSNLLLWVVSNCKPHSNRFEYIAELKKHIRVDVYGKCGQPHPCHDNQFCAESFLRRYKFYLAFENAECHDYITEKFWRALRNGVVPVVLGATVAEYEALAPPDSFIHVDNFTSVSAMARYLTYLDSNPEAYKKYLHWTKSYRIGGKDPTKQSEGALCRMCATAHNKSILPERSYKISEWFSVQRLCRQKKRNYS